MLFRARKQTDYPVDRVAAAPEANPTEAQGAERPPGGADNDGAAQRSAVEAEGATSLRPEELRRHAEASKRVAATLGELVSLFMRSPRHRDYKLSDLRWLVLPAIRTGQLAIAASQSKSRGHTAPVAAVLWASVSLEIDARLAEKPDAPIRLAPKDCKSGEIVWIVQTVGDDRVVSALVRQLQAGAWKGKVVKARVKNSDDSIEVRVIGRPVDRDGAPAGRH